MRYSVLSRYQRIIRKPLISHKSITVSDFSSRKDFDYDRNVKYKLEPLIEEQEEKEI